MLHVDELSGDVLRRTMQNQRASDRHDVCMIVMKRRSKPEREPRSHQTASNSQGRKLPRDPCFVCAKYLGVCLAHRIGSGGDSCLLRICGRLGCASTLKFGRLHDQDVITEGKQDIAYHD